MRFAARVITGAGRGKGLGFPTLNLELSDIPIEADEGIYAGKAIVENSEYLSAIHYGPRPFYNDSKAFEVHLIDVELTELPSEIEVELIERLRDIQDFENEEELKKQISRDIEETLIILENNK